MKNTLKYNPRNSALKIKLPILDPQEDYECWYFESILENGDQIRISIRINETHNLPITYGVQVEHIESGEIRVISDSFSSNEVEFSTEKLNHKLGNNWFLDLGDYIEIHTEINCTIMDLKFYPEIAGFNNRRDGRINQNIPGTKYFGWNIPIPKALVKGFINRDGQKIDVKGTGYFDHFWSNSLPENNINQLCWGKIFDKDISIYYTLISEDEKSISSKLIIASKENVILKMQGSSYNDILKAKVLEYVKRDESEITIPNKILLQHNGEFGYVNIIIELDEINHEIVSENHRLRGKKVLRFIGNESYTIKKDSKELSGATKSLHEIIVF